jgi:hypothetical protein
LHVLATSLDRSQSRLVCFWQILLQKLAVIDDAAQPFYLG